MFRSRRVISMLLVGLYLAWLVAVTWYVWPRSGPEPTPGRLVVEHHRELVVTAAWAMLGLQLLTVLVTVLLLIGSLRRAGGRPWYHWATWVSFRVALVFGLTVSPLALLAGTYLSPQCHPWRTISQVHTSGGITYRVQRFGEWDILSEELSRDRYFIRTRVLAVTQGVRRGVPVVRPADAAEYRLPKFEESEQKNRGRLVQSSDGRWLVFLYPSAAGFVHSLDPEDWCYGCKTSLAYDLREKEPYGGDSLDLLSPFFLIGPDDQPDEEDLQYTRVD